MATYIGNSTAGDASTDPPTFNETADGQNRKAASVNPQLEQLMDLAAAYVHFGAKQNKTNVFNAAGGNAFQTVVLFQALVTLGGQVREKTYSTSIAAGSLSQVLDPATANRFLLPDGTGGGGAGGHKLYLSTGGSINDGDWIELFSITAVTMGNVWEVRRQGSTTASFPTNVIAKFDNTLDSTGLFGATFARFEHTGGVWRLTNAGGLVYPGSDA
jgi:hypothetical protein